MKPLRYAFVAALALAGCAAVSPQVAAPPPVAIQNPQAPEVERVVPAPPAAASSYRPGTGTVQSMVSEQSASAGASAPASAAPPYLMTVRMDDGTTQTVRENSLSFLPGERVRITAEGRIVRP